MNVYHEETMELLPDPDLELGRTYPGRRFVAHHEAVEEVRHLEVMRGSEAMNGGKGLRGPVIDVPASPAWDEYEDCLLYHPYTEEELAAMHPPDPTPTPDTAATWDELAAAYTEGGGKCMMDSKTLVLEVLRSLGQREATELRQAANTMTGTEIIAAERAVPAWSHEKDYSDCPVGAPAADEGQVWLLIQPHNAANYQGRPSTLRALWGLAHTTDPARAKPWVDPQGTSGMYMAGECYLAADGTVYRCLQDNTVHDATALPGAWEVAISAPDTDTKEDANETF